LKIIYTVIKGNQPFIAKPTKVISKKEDKKHHKLSKLQILDKKDEILFEFIKYYKKNNAKIYDSLGNARKLYALKYEDGRESVLRLEAPDKSKMLIAEEYKIASKLSENIPYVPKVKLIQTDATSGFIGIEYEWCGKSLFSYMEDDYVLQPSILLEWMRQSAAGLHMVEKSDYRKSGYDINIKPNKMLYLDGKLKIIGLGRPMNILSQRDTTDKLVPDEKLTAGLPKLSHEKPYIPNEICCYFPPELLVSNHCYHYENSDVYIWAMLFYRLISKKSLLTLWEECKSFKREILNYNEFLKKVDSLTIGGESDIALKVKLVQILKDAMNFEWEKRPTFEMLEEKLKISH